MSNVYPMPPPGHPAGCRCGCTGPSPKPCGRCHASPCQCNENPSWGYFGSSLRQCQRELEEFKEFVCKIIADCPDVPLKTGPIAGDVTGKVALAGQVGEFLTNTISGTFLAAFQIQSVAAIIVSPGDWDVSAEVTFNGVAPAALNLTGAAVFLNPAPQGIVGPAYAVDPRTATGLTPGTVATADTNGWASLVVPRFQACVASPTLLAFQLETNLTAAGAAGTFNFITTARRMR